MLLNAASEPRAHDRRNLRHTGIWGAAYAVTLISIQALFSHHRELLQVDPLRWLAVAVILVLGIGVLHSGSRYLREADELERRIQLSALALSFGAMFLLTLTHPTLIRAGIADLEPKWYACVGLVGYVASILYGRWRYR